MGVRGGGCGVPTQLNKCKKKLRQIFHYRGHGGSKNKSIERFNVFMFWLCEFEANEFLNTRIVHRQHSEHARSAQAYSSKGLAILLELKGFLSNVSITIKLSKPSVNINSVRCVDYKKFFLLLYKIDLPINVSTKGKWVGKYYIRRPNCNLKSYNILITLSITIIVPN